MSTTTKKASTKGIRYTDAQKKEVIDFATNYNASNGRGGQSKAADKFGVSQLTIATWLKSAGAAKAPKVTRAAKAAKAPKVAKAAKTAGKLGSRYTDEQKKALTDFVATYNAANGRGGSSQAAKKFGVSPLTVVAWLKAAGVKGSSKVAKKVNGTSSNGLASNGSFSSKLTSLLALSGQIDKAEAELAQLKAKFSALKASL